jgi:ERF superfamily
LLTTSDPETDFDYNAELDRDLTRAPILVQPPSRPQSTYGHNFRESIQSTASMEYNTAFLAVQMKLEALIIADKANPFTKSKFASLGQLLATVKPILNKNGLILKQFAGAVSTHGSQTRRWYSIPIHTLLIHVASGQWESIVVDLPVETTTYSYGSALTFGKRYGLQSYLGIATVDDDGAATIQNRIDEKHAEEVVAEALGEIKRCKTNENLAAWLEERRDGFNNLMPATLLTIRNAYAAQREELNVLSVPATTDSPTPTPKRRGKGVDPT